MRLDKFKREVHFLSLENDQLKVKINQANMRNTVDLPVISNMIESYKNKMQGYLHDREIKLNKSMSEIT